MEDQIVVGVFVSHLGSTVFYVGQESAIVSEIGELFDISTL